MATPLRPSLVSFESADDVEGMFVVHASRASGPIPRLPALRPKGAGLYAAQMLGDLVDDPLAPTLNAPELASTFDAGDIVILDARRRLVRSVLSRRANANTLLVTERCDNRCLFCSQPPNDLPDVELYRSAAMAILNFDTDGYVGVSGGEPTLNRAAFLTMLAVLNAFSSRSKLHVLSNGRSFADTAFANDIAIAASKQSVLWGIPLYGHRASLHDPLVGADGAFVETTKGLVNASSLGLRIELRIVPTQQNIAHVPRIARFIVASFPGIVVISVMNLEPKGWARANYQRLYVPVREQNSALLEAAEIAEVAGRALRLFNYPLCLLADDLRRFAVRSISDWKNYYPPECSECSLFDECGGFFTSATGQFREPVQVQR